MSRILYFLFFIIPVSVGAQAYDWQWMRSATGNNSESVNSIVCGLSGNVVVTGYSYSSNLNFGNTVLQNYGNFDFFVACYDASGNELWVQSSGGSGGEMGKSLATDAVGNIYVAGYFNSPLLTVGSTTIANTGFNDGFVLKLDANGNVIWLKGFGSKGNESINGISTYGSEIFITGSFRSDTLLCGTDTLLNTGKEDAFLCKMTGSGNYLWSKSFTGKAADVSNAITNDLSGNVFISGTYSSPEFSFYNDTISNQGSSDVFVSKFTSTGNLSWLKSLGGIYNDEGYSMTCDLGGNVYLTGTFNSPGLIAGSQSLVNQGGSFDVFLARYDGLGNANWILSEGGIFDENGYGVVADQGGNVFLTGHYHSPSIVIGADTFFSAGLGDIFLSAYSSNGGRLWSKSIGGGGDDGSAALARDASDNLIVGGFFASPQMTCSADSVVNSGAADLFFGKLNKKVLVTKISSLTFEQNLIIYPNPSTGFITIESEAPIRSLLIYDSNGNTVELNSLSTHQIDLSSIAKGVYLVKIESERGAYFRRIVLI